MKDKELDALIKHYTTYLGDVEILEYAPSSDMPFKPQLVWAKPTKQHPYNIIATVGLSDAKLKGTYSNCELVVLLDPKWKFKLDNNNYNWPFELMHKISNVISLGNHAIGYGQYFINEDNKPFGHLTDMSVALIGVPAMLDKKFFELKCGKKLTNFFVLTTATSDELKLIKQIGGINFIQHYLLPEGEESFIIRNNRL